MKLNLINKNAIVCASSQGLGKAAALDLAHEGVNLAICSRDQEKINKAKEEILEATDNKIKVIALKGPVFLALVNYLIPVWALILGIFLLNERINFIVGFGLIFITIGIWLIEKRTK